MQTKYIKDAEALEVFKDCQNRIRSMALIHEKLYRSEGPRPDRFQGVSRKPHRAAHPFPGQPGDRLRHELEIEAVELDMDTAIPLGLIANELVSNCLKHAFTGRPSGLVKVILRKYADRRFQLVVQDDGNGLPAGLIR